MVYKAIYRPFPVLNGILVGGWGQTGQKRLEIPRGWGFSKTKKNFKTYGALIEISREVGVLFLEEMPSVGEVWILFLQNYTMPRHVMHRVCALRRLSKQKLLVAVALTLLAIFSLSPLRQMVLFCKN